MFISGAWRHSWVGAMVDQQTMAVLQLLWMKPPSTPSIWFVFIDCDLLFRFFYFLLTVVILLRVLDLQYK